jgi:5-methylcytosine-specific restriction enzyme subunit McrC
MPTVFEDFVTTALREALAPYPGHTRAQHETFLDEQQRLVIRPDVEQVVDGRTVAVFDAKYKLQSTGGRYGNDDTYQMLTYCTVLRAPTGWLVYARGDSRPSPHRIRHTSIDVVAYPLDLEVAPPELLDQISTLAALAVGPSP